ncbi:heterokaryon incompatibility protein-domain-containing protein [Hypoxylon sp. NC1633]|nr:heterokaryon incompatibility protein-domain-containing protein [Hypoxylon sp. NC1633]
MALYTYLEPRWLRLIKVHAGEYDDTVICDMITCCLDSTSRPKYLALSYTWGSELPIFEVLINGERVPVRSNLFDALRQIRAVQGQHQAISSEGYWWIDSICIDQEENAEKGPQVAMMGDIFEKSALTVVYLGEIGSDGHLAMNMLRKIAIAQSPEVRGPIRKATKHQVDALVIFFQRPWWVRAWTAQEYILPDALYLLCGDQALGRQDFQRAHSRLEYHSRRLPKYKPLHRSKGFFMVRKRKKILDIRYDILHGKGRYSDISLCDFLVYAGGSDATLEQDCVFSALGLVPNRNNLGLKPHYDDKGCVVIFEQLIRSQIISSSCLDIICFADASPRPESVRCPSWVPYWPTHKAQASDHLAWQSSPVFSSWRETAQDAIHHPYFKASAGLPPAVPGGIRPGALSCQCLMVGRIKALAGSFVAAERSEAVKLSQTTSKPENVHNASISTNEGWLQKARQYRPLENLWKTVVLDRKDSYLDRVAPRDYANDFKWLCFRVIEDPTMLNTTTVLWFRHHASVLFESHPDRVAISNRLNRTPGLNCGNTTDLENQMHNVWINMRKRLLVSDHNVLGMATEGAMVGDVIGVLAGCNFPVTMRETADGLDYQLIGECYLDGIMYGEMFDPVRGIPPMETFYLV